MSAIILAMLLLTWASGETGATASDGATDSRPAALTPAGPAGKPQPIVVTADRADMDYNENTAEFKDNVHVKDRSGDMWADSMVVHFDHNTREIKMVVATGRRVVIDAHDRRSQSRKAVYTASDGRIVLTGSPSITQGRNTYAADKITIFKDSEKTIFEPSARLIFYSDEGERGLGELR